MDLIFGERKVAGSLTGNPVTADTTLRFSALGGVSAMIETVPLDLLRRSRSWYLSAPGGSRSLHVRKTNFSGSVYRTSSHRRAQIEWLRALPYHAAIVLLVSLCATSVCAQAAPPSPDRQWIGPGERKIIRDAEVFRDSNSSVDPAKTYSLPELIDFAQSHNPETRFAWERARAQAAALGVARSELYPTLALVALS